MTVSLSKIPTRGWTAGFREIGEFWISAGVSILGNEWNINIRALSTL